jgi:hypothetical protein
MFKKTILSSIILTTIALTGCKDRAVVESELGYVNQTVTFNAPIIHQTTQFYNSTKRGIDDYNCDGIEDMVAMSDQTSWFEKQDFKADFYEGYYKDGFLNFKPSINKINIPFRVEKWVDQFKLDSVNVNNDTCSDIVYTGFTDNYNGRFKLKFAINDDRQDIYSNERMIPLETHFNNKEYYKSGIGQTENAFIEFIHEMQEEVYYDSEEDSIYSYLKQDWCDVNGDGADDFILLWDLKDNLSVLVAYSSQYGETGYSQFVDTERFFIKDFLDSRSIANIDTEDYDGNGTCDIISYKKTSNDLILNIATFKNNTLIPEKRQILKMPEGLDWHSDAEKFDTFDRNKDGKADLNFITEKNDKQVIVTWTSK